VARWIVEGADSYDGRDRSIEVDAPDRETAEAVGNDQGIFVARVRAAGTVSSSSGAPTPVSGKVLTEQTSKEYKGYMLMGIMGMVSTIGGCVLSPIADNGGGTAAIMVLMFIGWAVMWASFKMLAWWEHG
jgi:hypothetical protein